MQTPEILFVLIFCVLLAVIGLALITGFHVAARLRQAAVRRSLGSVSVPIVHEAADRPLLVAEKQESSLSEFLARNPMLSSLRDRINSAGADWPLELFLSASLFLGACGAVTGYYFPVLLFRELSVAGLATALFVIPFLSLEIKRQSRFQEFEEQFPEALDFIARAIRAGHAFSVSLEMLANESGEPIRTEFKRVFNEVNLGLSLETALKSLAARVPLVDVKFFVSAVLLQRETGGNLSEILVNLTYTIRERFRLKGQVKAATAHARVTAMILTALPIGIAASMLYREPSYYDKMLRDPDGKLVALGAILAQVVGYLIIKRLIAIKV